MASPRQRRRQRLQEAETLASLDDGHWGRRDHGLPTPMIELPDTLTRGGRVLLKQESQQPGGSIKGRVAAWVLAAKQATGRLKTGDMVVTASSGSFALGLAVAGERHGHPITVVVSEGLSHRQRMRLAETKAHIIAVPQVTGSPGRVTGQDLRAVEQHARSVASGRSNTWFIDQLREPACLAAHMAWTAPEILRQCPDIDVFVAAVGSAGTFIGTTLGLRKQRPELHTVAVEPSSAAVLGPVRRSGTHKMRGCGFGFVPPNWTPALARQVAQVSDTELLDMQQRLWLEAQLDVGASGAAAVVAAICAVNQRPSATVVAIAPDASEHGPSIHLKESV